MRRHVSYRGWIDHLEREETPAASLLREAIRRNIEPAMRGARPVLPFFEKRKPKFIGR